MSDETATKACCKCGIDVSKAKRHKDAKSRYWCEPCFARAAEEAKAKADAKGGGAGKGAGTTPAWLAGSLAVEGKRCTACSAAMPTDGVICTTCGHNSETGKAVGTRVVLAPKEKTPKESKGSNLFGSMGGALQGPAAIGFSTVGGLVGGAIGAFIWAMIAKSAQVEIGYVAWLVGALSGGGVAVVAGGHKGLTTGVIAAVIGVAAVFGGRYWAISMLADEMVGKLARTELKIEADEAPFYIALDVTREWEATGQLKNWVASVPREEVETIEDFPVDIQQEAMKRWISMSQTEKTSYLHGLQQRFTEGAKAYVKENAFMESFDFLDGIFALVAIVTAFMIGSGGSFEE